MELPQKYVRNYRLTLDYEEDLIFYNALFSVLKKRKLKPTILNIFSILDKYKNLKKINENKKLVYLDANFKKKT